MSLAPSGRILECSSKGDKRYSAFSAYITLDGKRDSIENFYQLAKRFYGPENVAPMTWREAKGKDKIPTHVEIKGKMLPVEYLSAWYRYLWYVYLKANPALVVYASQFDSFNDVFRGKSKNCQADMVELAVKHGVETLTADPKVKEIAVVIEKKEIPLMATWIDFTRRNDPACEAGLNVLEQKIAQCIKNDQWPDVLCFWTKNPQFIAIRYHDHIQELKSQGVVVLAQVTVNPGYQPILEPSVNPNWWDSLNDLSRLLGAEECVRLRFDPVVKGFTAPLMFKQHVQIANAAGIIRTVVNFLVPSYKGVGGLLAQKGISTSDFSGEKRSILEFMVDTAAKYSVRVSVCAEHNHLAELVPGLGRAKCSDATWALSFKPGVNFTVKPSRKGCGCCNSADWGQYHNQGSYSCPHQCLYCYAK